MSEQPSGAAFSMPSPLVARSPAADRQPPAGRGLARPPFRLRGRPRRALLTIHVLTSVGWFGIAVAVVFCWIAASVTADKALSSALYGVLGIAPWLSASAGIAAAVTGAILGLSSQLGLIRHWWVLIKVVITVVVVVVDATLVAAFARHAAATGHGAPALYGSTSAHLVVLVIATVLSVFKPRGLTPWGRARIPARRRPPGGRASKNIPSTSDQVTAEE